MDAEELVKEILREMFGDQLKPETLDAIAKSVVQDNDFIKQLQRLARMSKEIQKMLIKAIKKQLEAMKSKILEEIHRDRLKEQRLREERIQQFKEELAVLYEMWLSMMHKKELEEQKFHAGEIDRMFQEVNNLLGSTGEAYRNMGENVVEWSPQNSNTYQTYMGNQ